jgi:transcriptional regulator with XRE-family HTH domain
MTTVDAKAVRESILGAIRASGKTLTDYASAHGVTRVTLSNYAAGKITNPPAQLLASLGIVAVTGYRLPATLKTRQPRAPKG